MFGSKTIPMSNTSTNLIVLVAGLAVGAALGILLAPASGKETREKLMRKGGQLRDKVSDMVDDAKKMVGDVADSASKAQGPRTSATQG